MSATRASVESTGWQAMNTSRSRSSPTSSSRAASRSRHGRLLLRLELAAELRRACARAACSRRSRSIARCLAVAMSQAPGLSGTPDSGHRSSAATSASWARSSARPTSRTIRARPAMSLARLDPPDRVDRAMRSGAVTAPNHAIFSPRCKPGPAVASSAALRLCAHLLAARPSAADLGAAKSGHLVHLPDLDSPSPADLGQRLAHSIASSFDFTWMIQKPAISSFVSANGPSMTVTLAAGELDPRALRAGLQPVGREQHAGLRHLLVVLPHVGHLLLGRRRVRLLCRACTAIMNRIRDVSMVSWFGSCRRSLASSRRSARAGAPPAPSARA